MTEASLQEIASIADRAEAESQGEAASSFAWESASHTDVGRVRHINEDAFLDSQEQRLWVVADGMGGHSRGDYASGAIVALLRAGVDVHGGAPTPLNSALSRREYQLAQDLLQEAQEALEEVVDQSHLV